MKNLFLLVICISVFSCRKGTNTGNGPLNPIYDTLKFEVLGLEEKSMTQTDTLEFSVQVKYVEGRKDLVTLAVSDVPLTMTVGFYPQLDTPTFFSTIRFVTHSADTGLYHIKVTAAGTRFARDYDLPIRVLPYPLNPALALVGSYLETGPCSINGNVNNNVSISVTNPDFNKITISRLWNGSSTVNLLADVDPANKTIQIPPQQVSGQSFSGYGVYSDTVININYTITGTFFTETCTTILTKQ